jgi:hypothetical protein
MPPGHPKLTNQRVVCDLCPTAQVRVGKWLTELERNFYGSSMAYDKACLPLPTPLAQLAS